MSWGDYFKAICWSGVWRRSCVEVWNLECICRRRDL